MQNEMSKIKEFELGLADEMGPRNGMGMEETQHNYSLWKTMICIQ